MRTPRAAIALGLVAVVGLAGCGKEAEKPAASGDPVVEAAEDDATTTTTNTANTVAVTGTDYSFKGLPPTVKVGSSITFANTSAKEAHELVLLRINDGESRRISDLLALPEAEAMKVASPVGAAVALPGASGQVVDGALKIDKPGRYAAVCFIPVGADPKAMEAAMKNPAGGPPPEDPNAGPPHFTRGMVQEFTAG